MITQLSRRRILRGITVGATGIVAGMRPSIAKPQSAIGESNVALVKGSDRRDNLLRALEMIQDDVKNTLGNRQVVIKPNYTRVAKEDQLASTHTDNLWALCEFFSSFHSGNIIIAEGVGTAEPLEVALKNYDCLALQEKYNVEFFDLGQDDYTTIYILDGNTQPVPIRTSKLLLRPDVYIVSAAVLKTHSLAIVTLGLKNLLMAAPMKYNTRGGKEEKFNDRPKMHAGNVSDNPRPFNFNLFQMATHMTPDLVTIDGLVGMEGNGPIRGTARESNLAVASTDWLAADRVGTDLMGFDINRIGHLRYAAETGMGQADITKIRVIGETIGNMRQPYKPPSTIDGILM
jgi:uncharacterized protein (DUF362 family)